MQVERFHTPKLTELVNEKVLVEEAFYQAKINVIREIMGKFNIYFETWAAVMRTSAERNPLLGLTLTSPGDGIRPIFRPEVLPNN